MRTMSRLAGAAAALILTPTSMIPAFTTSASAQSAAMFERFGGGWSGAGTVRLANGGVERLRCRGAYAPAGRDQLRLNLACASDSFKVQIASTMVRRGERIEGTWTEASFGVSGNLNGSVRGDRIDAAISGPGVSARLSMAVRGDTQAVSLVSQSQISGAANVMLHRE